MWISYNWVLGCCKYGIMILTITAVRVKGRRSRSDFFQSYMFAWGPNLFPSHIQQLNGVLDTFEFLGLSVSDRCPPGRLVCGLAKWGSDLVFGHVLTMSRMKEWKEKKVKHKMGKETKRECGRHYCALLHVFKLCNPLANCQMGHVRVHKCCTNG